MSFNVRDLLSPEELARFTTKSDPQGARAFAVAWLSIIVSFAIPAIWPNPLTVILAIILLGGCQQSVGVLMHECGHNTLFKTPALNRWFGTWLASAPIFSDLQTYARGHMGHHKYAGTEQDPDKSNYQAYPVSKASFRRKVIRDLTGQTGLKLVLGGLKQRDALQADNVLVFPLRSWLVNGLMLAVLVAIGQGWLYLLWLTAFLTTYMLCLRLRQVAEHAGVPDLLDPDPRQHTRTTYHNPVMSHFLGCHDVNYHLEHHLLPGVPSYHLRALHRCLKERGAYDEVKIAQNFTDVYRLATFSS